MTNYTTPENRWRGMPWRDQCINYFMDLMNRIDDLDEYAEIRVVKDRGHISFEVNFNLDKKFSMETAAEIFGEDAE